MAATAIGLNPNANANLWRAWLGFNFSHSLGLVVFGATRVRYPVGVLGTTISLLVVWATGGTVEGDGHVGAVWTGVMVTKGLARDEPGRGVQSEGRCEGVGRAGLETHELIALIRRRGQEVVEHRSSDPLGPGCLAGVHRLQFGVGSVEVLERSNPDERTIATGAEDRDRGIQQSLDVQGVGVLRRRAGPREPQMPL